MNLASLAAKGVNPIASSRGVLYGWRLRFNVAHFFSHEGGVGNIEPTSSTTDKVWGVLHYCNQSDLSLLDSAEAYGYGYDRTSVTVKSVGRLVEAVTYIGLESFLDDTCLPSQRYLNILIDGAIGSQLPNHYIEALRETPILQPIPMGKFSPPPGPHLHFTADMLSRHPNCTALAGHVFDMSGARSHHDFLKQYFAGRDMTIYHLKRMHGTDGNATINSWNGGQLTPEQECYINDYLHAYDQEYRYCGTIETVHQVGGDHDAKASVMTAPSAPL